MYKICIFFIGVKMIRTQIYFTKRQKKFFKKEAKRLQTTQASLIRSVLDGYIDNKENRNEK
jgi:hypothetical protein